MKYSKTKKAVLIWSGRGHFLSCFHTSLYRFLLGRRKNEDNSWPCKSTFPASDFSAWGFSEPDDACLTLPDILCKLKSNFSRVPGTMLY